jgi:MFS transporter, OPA family, solute carrier family 37 (glycerol-3-phosphate transporter), member 3
LSNSYGLIHTIRKNYSNIKTTLSSEWRKSCDSSNTTCIELKPDSIWNRDISLFENQKDATLFLGIVDSIYLFVYAIVILYFFFF